MITGYSRRKAITIPATSSDETNKCYVFTIAYESEMQSQFQDVRFVDSDEETFLSQYRRCYTESSSSVWVVKIPSKLAAGKTIYVYYGNSSASLSSDVTAVATHYWTMDDSNFNLTEINVSDGDGYKYLTATTSQLTSTTDIADKHSETEMDIYIEDNNILQRFFCVGGGWDSSAMVTVRGVNSGISRVKNVSISEISVGTIAIGRKTLVFRRNTSTDCRYSINCSELADHDGEPCGKEDTEEIKIYHANGSPGNTRVYGLYVFDTPESIINDDDFDDPDIGDEEVLIQTGKYIEPILGKIKYFLQEGLNSEIDTINAELADLTLEYISTIHVGRIMLLKKFPCIVIWPDDSEMGDFTSETIYGEHYIVIYIAVLDPDQYNLQSRLLRYQRAITDLLKGLESSGQPALGGQVDIFEVVGHVYNNPWAGITEKGDFVDAVGVRVRAHHEEVL